MFSNISRFFVWIIMGLVLVGLVGFGSFNFGSSGNSIGKVGDTEIDASSYFRELNYEFDYRRQQGQNITMAQAQAMGLDQAVLARVIATTALEDETARLGLSVGDQNLAEQIRELTAFQGVDGTFDRETYDFVLDQSGLTKREFEGDLRSEVARNILGAAVTQGVNQPSVYTDTLFAWARETRDFTWAEINELSLEAALPAPTEDELQAYYDANPDEFTTPETRQITYAWLRPDDLVAEVPVEDSALQDLYQDRIDEYQVPERRLVERLVFGSEEQAQAARDRIDAGDSTFEDEAATRGLTLADIDMGDVTPSDLGDGSDEVFAMTEPGIVGPVMSDLGPALFRMNAVLPAQETTFEEARDGLVEEYAADAARRLVATRAQAMDEELASGATLEELADTGAVLGKIAWYRGMEDGIAAYAPFREAAASVTEDDYPEVIELEDGSVFALRLDEITPPALQPLDEVRDAVEAGWRTDALNAALVARAEELLPSFEDASEAPSTVGLTEVVEADMPRTAFIQGAPDGLIVEVFSMEQGAWQVVNDGTRVVVVRLDAIQSPDQNSEEAVGIKNAYAAQMSQTLATDVQQAFSEAIEEEAGVTIDRAMINAVNANFP